ncbi:MAG: IS1595 family transposase [Proteobacteria bacterium]|nr:IS1595 family transposase [Pseudomonadota bacterium]
MPINGIQMQKGLSLPEFIQLYGPEQQCEDALQKARWPQGFRGPKCHGQNASTFIRGKTLICVYGIVVIVRNQASLTAGTMMHQSQLPLTKWFLAVYLVTQLKTDIAALLLRRQLGIIWKAAWLLKHKLMEAMRQRELGRPLEWRRSD